jgi:hypothetical protein
VCVCVCLSVCQNEDAGRVTFSGLFITSDFILSSTPTSPKQDRANKYSSTPFSLAYILWCLWRRMYTIITVTTLRRKLLDSTCQDTLSWRIYSHACIWEVWLWYEYITKALTWNDIFTRLNVNWLSQFCYFTVLNRALWYTFVKGTNKIHNFYINILI